MDKKLPSNITNEQDLRFYEEYLKEIKESPITNNKTNNENKIYAPMQKNQSQRSKPSPHTSPDMMHTFLSNHIGKPIKVEFQIGNRFETKKGILYNVGKEYIVIKPLNNNATMVCDMKSIKFITVIHDNNISKLNRI